MLRNTPFVLLVLVACVPQTVVGQASFQGVGDLPGGSGRNLNEATAVSPDGTVVVGHSWITDSTWRAFRWAAETGIEMLESEQQDGSSSANAASVLGTIIVGWRSYYVPGQGDVREAVAWVDGVARPLAGLPLNSGLFDVTPDGTVIVGTIPTYLGQEPQQAFRTRDGFVEPLGTGEYGLGSSAKGVSSDGSVVVGTLRRPNTEEAMRWTSETGMVGLGWLTDSDPASWAIGGSSDGSVVVGASGGQRPRAFQWKDGMMTSLGGLSADDYYSVAFAASSDGWTIVGKAQVDPQIAEAAFIWDPVFGMRRIADVLTNDYGVDLEGWDLREADSVSDDGQTIVGVGFNPDGNLEGWVATIPSWRQHTVVASNPPDGIVDARQDFSTSGLTRRGYDRVRLTLATAFRDPVTHGPINVTNFSLDDSLGNAPALVSLVPVPGYPTTFDIVFEDPINPGAWSTLSLAVERPDGLIAEASVAIGFLPGDANGDGMSAPSDILRLIDNLNGVYHPPMEMWQCDIDRSGVCGPPDILRLIDLLNGANTSRPWLNVPLPPRVRAREVVSDP